MKDLGIDPRPLAGQLPAWHAAIERSALRAIAEKARTQKARLVALWGSDETPREIGRAHV